MKQKQEGQCHDRFCGKGVGEENRSGRAGGRAGAGRRGSAAADTFDEVYEQYNAIQQAQGLDLTPYQGKRAMLYTYALTAYPTGEQGVTANLLVRRNRLIAADITSAQTDGFVHGLLDMPQT